LIPQANLSNAGRKLVAAPLREIEHELAEIDICPGPLEKPICCDDRATMNQGRPDGRLDTGRELCWQSCNQFIEKDYSFMAAPDESQGLKIAVAALLTISVILAVGLYFLYAAYSAAGARLDAALNQNRQLMKTQMLLQTHYNELKKQMSKPTESPPK
jgi:hypothetical protein